MSDFINNIIKLTSGSIAAQVLGILLIPVITRFYVPNDFGIFQLILSITSIMAAISCMSYQFSIMLPKEEEDSATLVVLCVILIFAASIFSALFLFIFSEKIETILKVQGISNYLVVIPFIIFLRGFSLPLNYWLSRKVRYGIITASRLANAVSSKIIQIIGGLAGPSPAGLILGFVAGQIIDDCMMLKQLKNDSMIFKKVSFEKMKQLAIRYRKFPIFTTWSLTANEISLQVPAFFLAIFFSPVTVGYYSLANTVLNVPMSLIGGATGQVFYQKAAEEKNKTGTIKGIVLEVYKRLISIGIFPMLALLIISDDLFLFVFGPNWTVAGTYAKILLPWIFLVFISSPLSTLFSLLEKQQIGLSFNMSLLISRIVALYIGGRTGDPLLTLILFSLTGVVFWGWMNLYLLKISGILYNQGIALLIKYLLIAAFISIPLFFAEFFSLSIYIILFLAIVCALAYYLAIIFEDITLRKELLIIIGEVKTRLWR